MRTVACATHLEADEDTRAEQKGGERPRAGRGQGAGNVLDDEDEVRAAERKLREHQRNVHHHQPRFSEHIPPDLIWRMFCGRDKQNRMKQNKAERQTGVIHGCRRSRLVVRVWMPSAVLKWNIQLIANDNSGKRTITPTLPPTSCACNAVHETTSLLLRQAKSIQIKPTHFPWSPAAVEHDQYIVLSIFSFNPSSSVVDQQQKRLFDGGRERTFDEGLGKSSRSEMMGRVPAKWGPEFMFEKSLGYVWIIISGFSLGSQSRGLACPVCSARVLAPFRAYLSSANAIFGQSTERTPLAQRLSACLGCSFWFEAPSWRELPSVYSALYSGPAQSLPKASNAPP